MTLDAMPLWESVLIAAGIAAAVFGLCCGVKALARHILKKQAEKQEQNRSRES